MLWVIFQNLFTDASRNRWEKEVAKIIKCSKNQSDRSFPKATYTSGICSTAEMKGKEKSASLFYLRLYLNKSVQQKKITQMAWFIWQNAVFAWLAYARRT